MATNSLESDSNNNSKYAEGADGQYAFSGRLFNPAEVPLPKLNMTAVSVDLTKDAEMHARELARIRYEEEMRSKKFLKRSFGKAMRYYRQEKYYKEFHDAIISEGELNVNQGEDIQDKMRSDIVNQFVRAYEEEIRQNIIDTESGEKFREVNDDNLVFRESKGLIESYAAGRLDDSQLNQRIQQVRELLPREHIKDDDQTGSLAIDNLEEVARNARAMVDHGQDLTEVISNFKMAIGEARSDVRTAEHQTKVDKALRSFEDLKQRIPIARCIPTELLAGAASVGIWAGTSALKKAGRLAGLAGGSVVVGGVAGIQEHAKITEQRALHGRETARGGEYETENRRERGRKLNEMLYDREAAVDLVSGLEDKTNILLAQIESGGGVSQDTVNILAADLAHIANLKNTSSNSGVDLIQYSDVSNVVEERNNIAIAQAKAGVALRNGMEKLGMDQSAEEIIVQYQQLDEEATSENISSQDRAFAAFRRKEATLTGIKAGLTGLAFGVALQEGAAFFNENSTGFVEYLANKGVNDKIDARNTMLLDIAGWNSVKTIAPSMSVVEGAPNENLTPKQLQELDELRKQGFDVSESSYITQDTVSVEQTTSMSYADYMNNNSNGNFRSLNSISFHDNGTPGYYELINEQGGRAGYDASGNISFWDNFQQGSWRSSPNGTRIYDDMVNNSNLATIIGIKDGAGGCKLEVLRPGEVISKDSPLFNLLSFDDKGNLHIAGEGNWVSWGLEDGQGNIVSGASISGEGVMPEILTTESIEKTVTQLVQRFDISDKTVPVEADIPAAFGWWHGKELGVAERRSENKYSKYRGYHVYSSDGEMSKDYVLSVKKQSSPRIQRDAGAALETGEETRWYRDQIKSNRGSEYLTKIDEYIKNSPELSSTGDELRSIVTIPVHASTEQDNIYNTLSLYAQQEKVDPESNVILLFVNWKEHEKGDPTTVQANIAKTKSEIKRAQKDFPGLRIASFEHIHADDEARDAKGENILTGNIARRMNDTAVMTVENAISSGQMSADNEVIIIHNDADAKHLSKKYISNLQTASKEYPETPLFTGTTRFDTDRYVDSPGFGLVMTFLQAQNRMGARHGVIHTAGANFAFRTSSYAAVNGLGFDGYGGVGSDDLEVGHRIAAAFKDSYSSKNSSESTYAATGSVDSDGKILRRVGGAIVDTNGNRYLKPYVAGHSIHSGYGNYNSDSTRPDIESFKEKIKKPIEFNKMVKKIETNFTDMIAVDGENISRRTLSMLTWFTPGLYTLKRSDADSPLDFKFTAKGKKWLHKALIKGFDGKNESYGERKLRLLVDSGRLVSPANDKR